MLSTARYYGNVDKGRPRKLPVGQSDALPLSVSFIKFILRSIITNVQYVLKFRDITALN